MFLPGIGGCSLVDMWQSYNSNWQCLSLERYQQIRNSTNVLSALLSKVNSWKIPRSVTDFLHTEPESVDKHVFFS